MAKYIKGNFKGLSKAERALALEVHLKYLERIFRSGQVPFGQRHNLNEEIEEVSIKLTRSKSSPGFETSEFFELQRKYNTDQEYTEHLDSIINKDIDEYAAELLERSKQK